MDRNSYEGCQESTEDRHNSIKSLEEWTTIVHLLLFERIPEFGVDRLRQIDLEVIRITLQTCQPAVSVSFGFRRTTVPCYQISLKRCGKGGVKRLV